MLLAHFAFALAPWCLSHRTHTCLLQHFSREECQTCNQAYGKTCENELAKMIAPELALFGIAGRHKTPKLKHCDGDSYIHMRSPGTVTIALDPNDTRFRAHIDEEARTVSVTAYAPPFRPVSAIRSLIRSAWLLLSQDQRSKLGWMRDLATGSLQTLPFVYGRGLIPGSSRGVAKFTVCLGKNAEVPQVLVVYELGNVLLVWASPDMKSGIVKPFPLPPIQSLPGTCRSSLTMYCVYEDVRVDPKSSSFSLSYSDMARGGDMPSFVEPS